MTHKAGMPEAEAKEGCVAWWRLVPESAIDWLMGSGPAPDGKWFGEDEPDDTTGRRYWWRSRFRELIGDNLVYDKERRTIASTEFRQKLEAARELALQECEAAAEHKATDHPPQPSGGMPTEEEIARAITTGCRSCTEDFDKRCDKKQCRCHKAARAVIALLPPQAWRTDMENAPDEEIASPATYAETLATALWEKHWKDAAPHWKPLSGDLIGLLTQIDNMTVGLCRAVERCEQ